MATKTTRQQAPPHRFVEGLSRARHHSLRLLNGLLLLLLGLALPAASQEQFAAADALCRSMGPRMVITISVGILLSIVLILGLIYWRLQHGGWSLANAASEPTTLRIPLDANWAQSAGDRKSLLGTKDPHGPVVSLTVMEASSSRLIALAGMVCILFVYVGFAVFALYTFGLTCQMPASTVAVTTFLTSGLTLFAPYVANKVSGLLQPLRSTPPAPPEPMVALPAESPSPSLPPARPQLPEVTSAARNDLSRRTGAIPPHRTVSPPAQTSTPGPAVLDVAAQAAIRSQQASQGSATAVPPYGDAVRLIAQFEGFVDHAYPDPASGGEPWTIGYGFTSLDGRPVRPGDSISRAEADAQLLAGVNGCARHLATTIPYWSAMADDQRCALISFAWNLGEDFYGGDGFATISRALRERDWSSVPQALLLYCDPGTAVSDGLLRRRQAEGQLWQRGLSEPATPAASVGSSLAKANVPMATVISTARGAQAQGANPLSVPWFDQLSMDDGQGWRDCFSASSAMLAAFWGKEPNEDDYNALRGHYGDSTSAEAQLAALRHLGLKAEFRTDGTVQTLKNEIDAGRPVAVGWLHHGPPSAPSGGGHWTVVIGYDATGVIMNDPYGSCDLVNGGYPANHNGAHQHYSYANWEPRWRPQGSGGWYLVAQR
ncbi:MAG: glycoside hydrolase family protein [Cyanobacteriota bacterium]